jgi:hypothetical protein
LFGRVVVPPPGLLPKVRPLPEGDGVWDGAVFARDPDGPEVFAGRLGALRVVLGVCELLLLDGEACCVALRPALLLGFLSSPSKRGAATSPIHRTNPTPRILSRLVLEFIVFS